MKTTLLSLVLVVLLVCAACSSYYDETRVAMRMTEHSRAFEVAEEGDSAIPKGYSDLLIAIALKTPQEDPHLIKTMPARPDDYVYPVVINIDGQGTELRTQCKPDNQARYVEEKRNPEGGKGLQCSLVKRLRLKSGTHLFYVALPEDKLEREARITFIDSTINNMEVRPIYRRNKPFGREFEWGVENLDVLLNGQTIGPLLRPAEKSRAIAERGPGER